jgi:LysM repeat protein
MSRFSQYDSDAERLPEGMSRTGYDADTQRYQYQDADGSSWQGPPGSRYGRLERVHQNDDDHYTPTDPFLAQDEERQLQRGQRESWRYMLPFFLLCAVFVLLLFYYIGRPPAATTPPPVVCHQHSTAHVVKDGDTCWSIAQKYGATVDVLKRENARLDCDRLQIGQSVCVPTKL